MASSCAVRSALGVRNAGLSPISMSQSQTQARAFPPACAAPALIGKRSLPRAKATRSPSAESAFGSSRQLLGARTLPVKFQAQQAKAPRATGGALSSQAAYPAIFGLAPDTLQWIFTVASTALMFRLLPKVSHALLVPALFLNLPARVVEVMKQEAGAWVAVAVLVLRLFASLPSYVDLPLAVLLSILVAPYELLRFRGTQGAGIVSLAISIFIAYSHVTANNGVDNTLRSDVLPTTFAIALILLIPAALLLGAYAY